MCSRDNDWFSSRKDDFLSNAKIYYSIELICFENILDFDLIGPSKLFEAITFFYRMQETINRQNDKLLPDTKYVS